MRAWVVSILVDKILFQIKRIKNIVLSVNWPCWFGGSHIIFPLLREFWFKDLIFVFLLLFQLDLLSTFKVGAKKEFFRLWDENVPESVRNNDPLCKKLEFYLNIYFAIYPIKYNLLTGKRVRKNNVNPIRTTGKLVDWSKWIFYHL